jgi:hypothetical protein
MTETTEIFDADALRQGIDGDLFTATDATWDTERSAWNLAVDQRPLAVAVPANAEDVATIVRAARAAGLRVAPQTTGHNATPLGDLSGTILLKTSRLRNVDVDAEAGIARVGGGATWGDVAGPAAAAGLMPLQGSSHDVGVAGYTLGGGVSFLSRHFGLACERLRSVEMVTGDGEVRRVDSDNDPDLFWALKGGGGNFGIVTELEIELLPISEVYAGVLFFPLDRTTEIFRAYRDWVGTLPDEMGTAACIRHFPPFPEVPEPVRGQSFVIVEAYWVGDPAEADELLEPIRALEPLMDTMATVDAVGLLPVHMDPPEPVSGLGAHAMLNELDDATIDRIVAVAGTVPEGPPVMFEARHVGGALGRRAENCGALGAVEGNFIGFVVGVLPMPELREAVQAQVDAGAEALAPADAGTNYLNYTEESVSAERIFTPESLQRLREVHGRYDCGVFHANHPLGV